VPRIDWNLVQDRATRAAEALVLKEKDMERNPVRNLRVMEVLLHGDAVGRGPTVLVNFAGKRPKVRCGRLVERQALQSALQGAIAKLEKERVVYVAKL
jgi:hypothetical protein